MKELDEFLWNLYRQIKEIPLESERRKYLMKHLKALAREGQSIYREKQLLKRLWMARQYPAIMLAIIRAQCRPMTQLPQQAFNFLVNPLDCPSIEGVALWNPIAQGCVIIRTLLSRYGKPAIILIALAIATSLAAGIGVEYGLHYTPLLRTILSVLNCLSLLLATTSLGLAFASVLLALLGLLGRPNYLTKSPSLS